MKKLNKLTLREAARFQDEDASSMPSLSMNEKKQFVEAVKKFNEYGDKIFREDLDDLIETIKNIVETASTLTINEMGDDFDQITVNRHVKSMKESCKVFEKSACELKTLQRRMEAAYEDIGQNLNKYYEISENIDAVKKEEKSAFDGKKINVRSK